jgi:hypothetical protein
MDSMMSTIHILLGLNLVALAALGWRVHQQHRVVAALAEEVAGLAPAAALAAPALENLFEAGRSDLISIEILNPMELAARESWFAQLFGNLSPALIRKLVYERTQKILVEELKKYHVQAQVGLHRAR